MTITVTNGSTAVTGSGEAFLTAVKAGDLLVRSDATGVVASVTNNDALVLAQNWGGATAAGTAAFSFVKSGEGWHDAVTIAESVTDILAKLEAGHLLAPNAVGTFAERANYNDQFPGFIFWATNQSPQRLYVKRSLTSGDWSAAVVLQGEGPAGPVAGIQMIFDTGSTANSDPGDGVTKGNNASQTAITELYISTTDGLGADITAWLNALDDSTSAVKGQLFLWSLDNPTAKWRCFRVNSLTSPSAEYRRVLVTHVSGVGTLDDSETFTLTFYRSGDEGAQGPAGGGATSLASLSDIGATGLSLGQSATPAAARAVLALGDIAVLDWEDGTFTPAASFATNGNFTPGGAYANREGIFHRIGDRVYIDRLYLPFTSNAYNSAVAGRFRITGLPYASVAGKGFGLNIGYMSGVKFAVSGLSTFLAARIIPGTSEVALYAARSSPTIGHSAIAMGAVQNPQTQVGIEKSRAVVIELSGFYQRA